MNDPHLNLEHFWMPFTANRQFKAKPRMLVSAKDMHYTSDDGRQVLDGCAGLWCVNAGHNRAEIISAIKQQLDTLDFAPTFQMGHPMAFRAAEKVASLAPAGMNHVFFANSGSESVDSALKIALAYHRARGDGTRTKFIGRERGYHGVGFGGTSVGGIPLNRKIFGGQMLPGVDHLPHTHNIREAAFSRGQPKWGSHLAEDLERLVSLHDASNIAAVIVEPVAGSTGVLPPPVGYLETLRAICDKHGILLIFDEVISGFGRMGTPFAAQYFNVSPDLICCAKGITNATIPMGAVIVKDHVFDAFMHGPENVIDLFHGYTYSGHPVAAAAAVATLDLYQSTGLFESSRALHGYLADAAHGMRELPNVIDIRNIGMIAAVELKARDGKPGARAYEAMVKLFERGVMVRITGDTIALSPPLIVQKAHIDEMFGHIGEVLRTLD
ncbi:MAG: aspartate aminotransferase family protein [Proteobacteria bacterium]|nr:aspartate aminotransferase family protein [Burkholderiales bacterium]